MFSDQIGTRQEAHPHQSTLPEDYQESHNIKAALVRYPMGADICLLRARLLSRHVITFRSPHTILSSYSLCCTDLHLRRSLNATPSEECQFIQCMISTDQLTPSLFKRRGHHLLSRMYPSAPCDVQMLPDILHLISVGILHSPSARLRSNILPNLQSSVSTAGKIWAILFRKPRL